MKCPWCVRTPAMGSRYRATRSEFPLSITHRIQGLHCPSDKWEEKQQQHKFVIRTNPPASREKPELCESDSHQSGCLSVSMVTPILQTSSASTHGSDTAPTQGRAESPAVLPPFIHCSSRCTGDRTAPPQRLCNPAAIPDCSVL